MCCRLYRRLIYVGWSHVHVARRHAASAYMGRKWNFAVPHKFASLPPTPPISSPKSCDVPTSVRISSISELGSYPDCRLLWWNDQIISYSEPRINQPQQNSFMKFSYSHLLFPSLLSSFFLSGSFVSLETLLKGKAIPGQALGGPGGSDCQISRMSAHAVGMVSCAHRPALPLKKYSWYSFLLEAESSSGP